MNENNHPIEDKETLTEEKYTYVGKEPNRINACRKIQPAEKYTYVGKEPKRVKLSNAVCASVICIVLSVLLTFSLCTVFNTPSKTPPPAGGTQSETESENESVNNGNNGAELPQYFDNLVILDKIFSQYSFDGIDQDQMSEAILDAYVAATGDVYAEYLNAEEYEDYFSDRKGELVGIGVSVISSKITVNGFEYTVIQIISVFKDSPAMENGVMPGDCIMFVKDGETDKLVNEIGYTQALDLMLGEAGTKAEFTVYRPYLSDYEIIDFSIERRKVTSETVTYRVSETNSKVGIINITGFDLTTPGQFKTAVNTLLNEHKCEYFVFDVRNNPGGALDSIDTVLAYFLDEGDEIITTKYSDGSVETAYARAKKYTSEYSGFDVLKEEIGMYKDLKCIVLTNGNTASAAELFTATLRDYDIAEVVGVNTYGKGCMQSLIPLEGYGIEGGLKLTVAMYYSASKTVYHGTGIVPDYTVELSEEAKKINFFLLPEAEDNQLLTAIEKLVK